MVVYLPISKTCSSAFALKEIGLNQRSYPFDWIGTPYKSVADILDNGVDKLFIDYEIIKPFEYHKVLVWDKTYNILTIHETETDIDKIREKYIRRYHRMIEDLKKSDSVVLIQGSTCEKTILEHFKQFEDYFESPIPDESIDDNSIECVAESILKINPNIEIKITKRDSWENVVDELKVIEENQRLYSTFDTKIIQKKLDSY